MNGSQSSRVATFTPLSRVQAMLDVEVALAEALAEAAVIPISSVAPIRTAARAELYDLALLAEDSERAGNLLIPLVQQLRIRVAADDPEAAGHVHWGATSQDVMDTALVLQLGTAVGDILASLDLAATSAAALARRYATTPMAGRTWLQQATPTTFGLKAAGWTDGVARARERLAAAMEDARVVQLGGATGTLSSLGSAGPAVTDAFASRLGLKVPEMPWHSERSRLVAVACALGMACGSLGKIGRDIALLAQTEVGEVLEPPEPGRGGSSSMPHKRNPVASALAVAAAVQAPGLVATMVSAMPQEHERAVGGWQAEWDTLPALVNLTERAARAMARALAHLVVDEARMRANLDLAGGVARGEGLVTALAPALGRGTALALVERLSRRALAEGRPLQDVAADEPQVRTHLDAARIVAALDPVNTSHSSRRFVDRVLERWQLGKV
jgi:3-carboxy-cis,cis-muconate cycloisomerase